MASFISRWRKKAIALYGKARGLTKAQREKVTEATHKRKAAKRKAKKARKPKTRTRKRTVPKKRRRIRSFFSMNTVFKFVRIAAFVAPGWSIYDESKSVPTALLAYAGWNMTTKDFDAGVWKRAWLPYIIANLTTHGIQKLNGIIRRL